LGKSKSLPAGETSGTWYSAALVTASGFLIFMKSEQAIHFEVLTQLAHRGFKHV